MRRAVCQRQLSFLFGLAVDLTASIRAHIHNSMIIILIIITIIIIIPLHI